MKKRREKKHGAFCVRRAARIGLCTALLAASAWIAVPFPIPFTLQTLVIPLCCGLLGRRDGGAVILIYLMLGFVGLPVFAGFAGGVGILLGPSGGYLLGFFAFPLVSGPQERFAARQFWGMFFTMLLGLAACYTFGTAWFLLLHAERAGIAGLGAVLSACVLPYLAPDVLKLLLADLLVRRLRRAL